MNKAKNAVDGLLPWTDGKVALAHGTRVRMTYRNITHEGKIANGQWQVKGKDFKSPSLAANHVARTREHKKTRLNGWQYWEAYFAADRKWVPIKQLRG